MLAIIASLLTISAAARPACCVASSFSCSRRNCLCCKCCQRTSAAASAWSFSAMSAAATAATAAEAAAVDASVNASCLCRGGEVWWWRCWCGASSCCWVSSCVSPFWALSSCYLWRRKSKRKQVREKEDATARKREREREQQNERERECVCEWERLCLWIRETELRKWVRDFSLASASVCVCVFFCPMDMTVHPQIWQEE